jgi:SAM-dependent methyltransferase
MAEFDKDYWEAHWDPVASSGERELLANPYLATETAYLHPGGALDAGCGTGAEAIWLAEQGWQVTAADISPTALTTAQARAATTDVIAPIDWVEADLARWEPERTWDLVVTSYAHPDIGQLPFYRRIASWVAPGGTLLIVGHLHDHQHGDHHGHPENASATLEAITSLFDSPQWQIDAAYEHARTVHPGGAPVQLRDVIVRAHRTA